MQQQQENEKKDKQQRSKEKRQLEKLKFIETQQKLEESQQLNQEKDNTINDLQKEIEKIKKQNNNNADQQQLFEEKDKAINDLKQQLQQQKEEYQQKLNSVREELKKSQQDRQNLKTYNDNINVQLQQTKQVMAKLKKSEIDQSSLQLYEQDLKNIDLPDQILSFNSLESLLKEGFSFQLINHYQFLGQLVAIQGLPQAGKTLILNNILGINLKEGLKDKYGISLSMTFSEKFYEKIIFAVVRSKGQPYIDNKELQELETEFKNLQASKTNQKRQNEIVKLYQDSVLEKKRQLKSEKDKFSRKQQAAQQLIFDFIQENYILTIFVVNDYTSEQQEQYYQFLDEKEDHQDIYVIHNYYQPKYDTINKVLQQADHDMKYIYKNIEGKKTITVNNTTQIQVYQEIHQKKIQKDKHVNIYHLIMGYQGEENIREKLNKPLFEYLRQQIKDNKSGDESDFKIQEKFQNFLQKNLSKYVEMVKDDSQIQESYQSVQQNQFQEFQKDKNEKGYEVTQYTVNQDYSQSPTTLREVKREDAYTLIQPEFQCQTPQPVNV